MKSRYLFLKILLGEPQLFGYIRPAVSNKNTMQFTYVMLNFIVTTLEEVKRTG